MKPDAADGRAPRNQAKGVGMKDIAQALSISIGTVDRALHGKPGISPITRTKVLHKAKELGYRPNLAARYLSSGKQLRIGVNLPAEIALFFDEVREGIAEAARPFESTGTRVVYRKYPRMGEGEVEAFEEALADDLQGLIICPGEPARFRSLIRRAAHRNLPVMCVCSDAAGTERLAAVSADPFVSGAMVGELMGQFLNGCGRILLVTGFLATADHSEKVKGFQWCLGSMYPEMAVDGVIEAHEDEVEAYEKCRRMLLETPDINGVYVTTVNSLPVIRALQSLDRKIKPKLITTDLFPAIAEMLRSGFIDATIYQRPFNQGRIAFNSIYRFLTEGVCPSPVIRLAPHVVMRSNVDLFLHGRRGYGRHPNPAPALVSG